METYEAQNYDLAVIGAGHAGVEAALAAARLGVSTVLFTISLDGLANMPCNPSIGGTAKGHLVREIDALGGQMGKAADATFIQSRMLNRGKGPAVHSLRVQADRQRYHIYMKQVIERQENLDLKQAEIVEIRAKDGRVESGGYPFRCGSSNQNGDFMHWNLSARPDFCRRCFLRKRPGRTACGDPLERIIAGAGYSAAAL